MITEFPATALPTLQNTENVEVADGLEFGGRFADIFFNIVDPANCPADGGICSGHPALRDVEVRRALAQAVDKQQLVDTLLLGLGQPGLGWFLRPSEPGSPRARPGGLSVRSRRRRAAARSGRLCRHRWRWDPRMSRPTIAAPPAI